VFSMSMVTLRFLASLSSVFFSLILGVVAMCLFWVYFPDEFVRLQRSASAVRDWIAARAWSTRAESIIRFLLEDRQLLLISFALAVRLVMGLIALPIRALFSRGSDQGERPASASS